MSEPPSLQTKGRGSDIYEKRDRWSSYDPANHREIIEEYEKVEEAKRQLKAEKLKNGKLMRFWMRSHRRKENYIRRPDMINKLMEARGMLKSDKLKSHNRERGNAFLFSLLISRQLPRYYV
uniref:Pre-mRNA-splicing factor SLU7 domain-containing protein n=1 Tax=Glossina palpalis gambiensis TaxID=67801 RepID=A0A1B0C584_9MUSC